MSTVDYKIEELLARGILFRGLEVWRIRVRNTEPQLSVSVPVPAQETRVPLPVFSLLPQAASLVLSGQARSGNEAS